MDRKRKAREAYAALSPEKKKQKCSRVRENRMKRSEKRKNTPSFLEEVTDAPIQIGCQQVMSLSTKPSIGEGENLCEVPVVQIQPPRRKKIRVPSSLSNNGDCISDGTINALFDVPLGDLYMPSNSVRSPPFMAEKGPNAQDKSARKRQRVQKNTTSYVVCDTPLEPIRLPDANDCEHCGAKRFYMEPPDFCCSGGAVSIVCPPMPYALRRLFLDSDEESVNFRINVRTYNNNLAFTSLGAKYDSTLTMNRHGVYTFRVQGQIHHFLNALHCDNNHPPSGIQLYFYDSEIEIAERLNKCERLNTSVMKILLEVLDNNPYKVFLKQLREVENLENKTIVLNRNPTLDQRIYNLPSVSQVAAIFSEDCDDSFDPTAHIQIYTSSTQSHRIKHYFGCYDPLQYPLLFPGGETGWHSGIEKGKKLNARVSSSRNGSTSSEVNNVVDNVNSLLQQENEDAEKADSGQKYVTAREYYCYRFQMRENDKSMLLHALRLLQQFVVECYVKIETCRLDFHRRKQAETRSEILQGIVDSLAVGETQGSNVGKRVILPASFIGGPRDMRRRYLDAMTLVQKFGKPDVFLTITCNPAWPEIQENLLRGESPNDRPDLLARVFRARMELVKNEVIKKRLFGQVEACVYVIEFQKRGLPHCHMLLILKTGSRLLNPDAYNNVVSAELPDQEREPYLYSTVVEHMMHGPCGNLNDSCPCMVNGKCKHFYPKEFNERTYQADDGYPHYRRRNDGKKVHVRHHDLDNRWVVPYNPYLLAMFDCHINVEICSTVKLIKYVYKYLYKGHDRVSFSLKSPEELQQIDEIKEFVKGRWVGPSEAMWRIFAFHMNHMKPSVYTLPVHLEGHQFVTYKNNDDLQSVIGRAGVSKTMLTGFFHINRVNPKAQELNLLYKEMPEYFTWTISSKKWRERKKGAVIGRLVSVSPRDGERYYLRLLLNHVRGPKSFQHLRTVGAETYPTFRDAALKLGLLQSDTYIEDSLEEASSFEMPSALRGLFAILLVFCTPNDPQQLWLQFRDSLTADLQRKYARFGRSSLYVHRKGLQSINKYLLQMGSSLANFGFSIESYRCSDDHDTTREDNSERDIDVSAEDLLLCQNFNSDQQEAYNEIMSAVISSNPTVFFLDGPGGTGKTYLYRALLAKLRSEGHVALAVATSGVAASALPGGRTAHSRFKLPLDTSENGTCNISKQSSVARLIIDAKLIVWDEVTMARKENIDAFDSLLKDLMSSACPFGGKVVVFGGDFRQTLPVIVHGTRSEIISSVVVNSVLWPGIKKLRLTTNMRAILDPMFCEFLLRVGEGLEKKDEDEQITLPTALIVPYTGKDESLDRLIGDVFSDLDSCYANPMQMISRCILAPKNSAVDEINNLLIERFPGNSRLYTSFDVAVNKEHQLHFEDLFNSLNPNGMPAHKLLLKLNCPVMLLRNLNPTEGLCNGTRLICRELGENAISAEIAFGQHKGKLVFIPRIPIQSEDTGKDSIPFKRFQLPLRLCFAMTINKSQGQTLDFVGLYLREPVFSHGQLYVALSRAKTSKAVRVLLVPDTFDGEKKDTRTSNVVYEEIFSLASK